MAWVGSVEAARILGVTREALKKQREKLEAVGAARMELGRWKFNDERLEDAYDSVVGPRSDSPRVKARAEAAVAAAERMDGIPPKFESDARRAFYEAELRRIEFEEREGILTNAALVRAEAQREATALRMLLESIPDRVSGLLAAETDAGEVHKTLRGEIRQCLLRFAGHTEESLLEAALRR